MAKAEFVIPKGYKCKNGVCTTEELEFDLDLPEINPIINRIPEIEIKGNKKNDNQTIAEPKEVIKEITKEIKVVPSWQPNFICKGPNCNTKKNPAYTSRPKGICSNCGQFTKEAFGTCIWCQSKEIEELDNDKLDELGIPTPNDNEPDLEEAD